MKNEIVTLQAELLQHLDPAIRTGDIVVDLDFDQYLQMIWDAFPFTGSQIAWSRVPGSIATEVKINPSEASVKSFLALIVERANLGDHDILILVGDSAMDYALIMPVAVSTRYIKSVVEMPQHTYMIPPDASWCACFSMEGYMDFGFRPNDKQP